MDIRIDSRAIAENGSLYQSEDKTVSASTPFPSDKPHLIIRPSAGWRALSLGHIWQYRDLLTTFAERDVKLRYRQTALGVLWVILQPLIGAAVFSFFFNKVAKFPTNEFPPFLFAFAGMMGFTLFSATLLKASHCLVANSQLVSKVYFPRIVLPLSTAYPSLVDAGVSLVVVGVLLLWYRVAPGPGLLLLPVWIALILMLALGIGLFCSALMVSYRDVQYVVPVLVNFLLFSSPIAYPASFAAEQMSGPVQRVYFLINPLASLLDAFRWSLLGGGTVRWSYVGYAAMVAVVVFLCGAMSFRRMERRFADVI